jgi:surface polysaccharide O-acyltransferase-like enzyme
MDAPAAGQGAASQDAAGSGHARADQPLDGQTAQKRATRSGHEWLEYGPSIRGIAIIAILMGHTFDMAMFAWELEYSQRAAAIMLDSLFRWAVPAFIMISGAILLVPKPGGSIAAFYKKRVGRIGIPIVFWSAFFMWFDVYVVNFTASSWSKSFENLLVGRPYGHMFFIFRFVGLYLLTPAVRWVVAKTTRNQFIALTALLFVAVAIDSYIMNQYNAQRGAVIGTFYFLPFFMAGYILRTAYLSRRGIIIALGVWAAATLTLGLTTLPGVREWDPINMPAPSPEFAMWDHLSPLRIVIGISMWLVLITVLRGERIRRPFWRLMGNVIAPASFGIYLIHPLFRDGLHYMGITAYQPNVWIGVSVSMTAVVVWSVLATLLIMKIPYVRKIVV